MFCLPPSTHMKVDASSATLSLQTRKPGFKYKLIFRRCDISQQTFFLNSPTCTQTHNIMETETAPRIVQIPNNRWHPCFTADASILLYTQDGVFQRTDLPNLNTRSVYKLQIKQRPLLILLRTGIMLSSGYNELLSL